MSKLLEKLIEVNLRKRKFPSHFTAETIQSYQLLEIKQLLKHSLEKMIEVDFEISEENKDDVSESKKNSTNSCF